jgi:hypothetical protein
VFYPTLPFGSGEDEVRGFQLKRVQMRTLTLTLVLEKGEAN